MFSAILMAVMTASQSVFRLPGDCVKVTTQEVRPGGEPYVKVEVRCEFTAAIRARLAKEGK